MERDHRPALSERPIASPCSLFTRWTALRIVLLGSMFSVSPNSYGFGAAMVSMPVLRWRVS